MSVNQNIADGQYSGDDEDILKTDLETEHGLTNHPKRDKLWSLAWEHGHSYGYSEVAGYYEDFSELLK